MRHILNGHILMNDSQNTSRLSPSPISRGDHHWVNDRNTEIRRLFPEPHIQWYPKLHDLFWMDQDQKYGLIYYAYHPVVVKPRFIAPYR